MASSYGSERLTIEATMVGNVAVSNVRPVPALVPRIRFDLSSTRSRAEQHRTTEVTSSFADRRRASLDGLVHGYPVAP